MEKGEFGLTKWMSIDERVIAAVPERDRAKSFVSASLRNVVSERVLVVEWNVAADSFQIKVDISKKPATRRGILSMNHSLFDPLGFFCASPLEPKLLLKELSGHYWDDEISQKESVKKTGCCLSLIWRSCLFLAVSTQQGVAAEQNRTLYFCCL